MCKQCNFKSCISICVHFHETKKHFKFYQKEYETHYFQLRDNAFLTFILVRTAPFLRNKTIMTQKNFHLSTARLVSGKLIVATDPPSRHSTTFHRPSTKRCFLSLYNVGMARGMILAVKILFPSAN